MKISARVLISGNVQGVNFRDSIKDNAKILGLTGWVRNKPDGKVEAFFEGEEDLIKKVLDFCKKGPGLAEVTNIEIKKGVYQGQYNSFEVLR